MGSVLKIQLSAFSNKRIVPSANNIAIIMPKLKEISGIEFLPSVVNSQKIDISTGMIENVSNLSFLSADSTGQVICSDNRLDCIINVSADHQDVVEERFNTTSAILQFLMEATNTVANRLALNVTFVSDICNENSVFEKQVMHVVPFYQNRIIKEWSSRVNAEGTMTINNIEENLNIITEYSRGIEPNTMKTRILCHSDINTVAENRDFRFEHDAIDLFEKKEKSIFEEIQSDLKGLVKYEE